MGRRVTYRQSAKPTKSQIKWDKIHDISFSIAYWVVIFCVVIVIGVMFNIIINGQKGNAIENSNQWAGYSEVGVHQIFDRRTGVLYAVTDTGDICLVVDEEGNPRRVD